MASQAAGPPATPSAYVVGNMFVEQYYPVLRLTPENVHKFYQDHSVLSRPDANGEMISVTTMQAIDEKVMSLDYKNYTVEIKTVDAQHSYMNGVIVLVTGLLIGKDKTTQKFTQSFFLAPQEGGGFFVLNDVFRYVADSQPQEIDEIEVNGPDAAVSSIAPSSEPAAVPVRNVSEPVTVETEDNDNGEEAESPTGSGGSVVEEDVNSPVQSSQSSAHVIPEVTTNVTQEDTPKKSYASIVKVMKGTTTAIVSAPAKPQVTTVTSEKQSAAVAVVSPPTPPEVPVFDNNKSTESSNPPEDVEGYSIYIRNLPLNATPSQVEGEFKKFGTIKHDGVQVRNHKQHGYCFGFVEFETLNSMKSAIEASPVLIGGRNVVVEEKRTTTRVGPGGYINGGGGGRGRFPMGRGGFRNDNFHGRGGYGSGQGYGRSEFRTRGEFSHRGRGSGSRGTESYQRVGRPDTNQTAVSAA